MASAVRSWLARRVAGQRIDPAAFRALDLRCHDVLADVPLHDVWTVDLPGGGPGRTVADVHGLSPLRGPWSASLPVRALFAVRTALGRAFDWDAPRHDPPGGSYVDRLRAEDRRRSTILPGTRDGAFRILYAFERELLAEIRNATVHAFLVMTLADRPGGYTLFLAVYVKPVGRRTALYMAAIDPFRRLVVYPALLGELRARWARAYPVAV